MQTDQRSKEMTATKCCGLETIQHHGTFGESNSPARRISGGGGHSWMQQTGGFGTLEANAETIQDTTPAFRLSPSCHRDAERATLESGRSSRICPRKIQTMKGG